MIISAEETERTKAALADALLDRLETKPFSKITVKELTAACKIKRQSFYYHFDDIYALLEWVLEKDRRSFAKARDEHLCWQEYVLSLLKLIERNRKKYLNISNALGWRYISRFYLPDLHGLMEKLIAAYAQKSGSAARNPKFVGFLVDYYSIALSALLENWVHGNLRYTPEEIVEHFSTILNDEARGAAFRNLAEQPPAEETPPISASAN